MGLESNQRSEALLQLSLRVPPEEAEAAAAWSLSLLGETAEERGEHLLPLQGQAAQRGEIMRPGGQPASPPHTHTRTCLPSGKSPCSLRLRCPAGGGRLATPLRWENSPDVFVHQTYRSGKVVFPPSTIVLTLVGSQVRQVGVTLEDPLALLPREWIPEATRMGTGHGYPPPRPVLHGPAAASG